MQLALQLTAFLSQAAIAILAVAAWAFLIVPFWKRFGNYVSSGLKKFFSLRSTLAKVVAALAVLLVVFVSGLLIGQHKALVDQADAANPNRPPILKRRGEILLEQKQFDQAEAQFAANSPYATAADFAKYAMKSREQAVLKDEGNPAAGAPELPPQAKPISKVIVPIPMEVFGCLDKFSNRSWQLVQLGYLADAKPHGDQTQIALLFGVVIGEGFIAVEAHDSAEVRSVGRAVLELARALGVQPIVMRRSQSIVEHADRRDWSGVRQEWDRVLPDVEQGMKQLESEQLSQLVSLGGWLRGTRALTALILQRYSPSDAELLRQFALLDLFEKQLSEMRPNPSISRMQEGVTKMRSLVAGSDQPISEKSVRDLAVVCDELLFTVTEIYHSSSFTEPGINGPAKQGSEESVVADRVNSFYEQ